MIVPPSICRAPAAEAFDIARGKVAGNDTKMRRRSERKRQKPSSQKNKRKQYATPASESFIVTLKYKSHISHDLEEEEIGDCIVVDTGDLYLDDSDCDQSEQAYVDESLSQANETKKNFQVEVDDHQALEDADIVLVDRGGADPLASIENGEPLLANADEPNTSLDDDDQEMLKVYLRRIDDFDTVRHSQDAVLTLTTKDNRETPLQFDKEQPGEQFFEPTISPHSINETAYEHDIKRSPSSLDRAHDEEEQKVEVFELSESDGSPDPAASAGQVEELSPSLVEISPKAEYSPSPEFLPHSSKQTPQRRTISDDDELHNDFAQTPPKTEYSTHPEDLQHSPEKSLPQRRSISDAHEFHDSSAHTTLKTEHSTYPNDLQQSPEQPSQSTISNATELPHSFAQASLETTIPYHERLHYSPVSTAKRTMRTPLPSAPATLLKRQEERHTQQATLSLKLTRSILEPVPHFGESLGTPQRSPLASPRTRLPSSLYTSPQREVQPVLESANLIPDIRENINSNPSSSEIPARPNNEVSLPILPWILGPNSKLGNTRNDTTSKASIYLSRPLLPHTETEGYLHLSFRDNIVKPADVNSETSSRWFATRSPRRSESVSIPDTTPPPVPPPVLPPAIPLAQKVVQREERAVIQPLGRNSDVQRRFRDWAMKQISYHPGLILDEEETTNGQTRCYPEVCGVFVDHSSAPGIVVITSQGTPERQIDTGQETMFGKYADLTIGPGEKCEVYGNSTVLYYSPKRNHLHPAMPPQPTQQTMARGSPVVELIKRGTENGVNTYRVHSFCA